MTRPNRLEGLPLNTLSSQVFKFESKARANPMEVLSDASFLVKLLVLPANVRLGWKGLPGTNTLAFYENTQITDEKVL